jgi:hypothetical protein
MCALLVHTLAHMEFFVCDTMYIRSIVGNYNKIDKSVIYNKPRQNKPDADIFQ